MTEQLTEQQFEINPCPLCHKPHRYQLEISTSPYHFALPPSTSKPTLTKKTVTRLFTCPTKNEIFQATLELTESAQMPIASVVVKGLVEEAGNEK